MRHTIWTETGESRFHESPRVEACIFGVAGFPFGSCRRRKQMNDCKCGSGLLREEIRVKESAPPPNAKDQLSKR